MEVLRTDGRIALEKAIERSQEYGQHSANMTNLAQEARERADALDKHAKEIQKTAKEAKNISSQAHELYKKIQDDQLQISNNVNDLENLIVKSGNDLQQVQKLAAESLERATDAEKKAIETLNEVRNLIIPVINITALKKEAETAKDQSLHLLNETRRLYDNNDILREDIREQIINAQDLLEQGKEQQIAVTDLLGEADLAHSAAESAVNLSDRTLTEAKKTYNTLSGNIYYLLVNTKIIMLLFQNLIGRCRKVRTRPKKH